MWMDSSSMQLILKLLPRPLNYAIVSLHPSVFGPKFHLLLRTPEKMPSSDLQNTPLSWSIKLISEICNLPDVLMIPKNLWFMGKMFKGNWRQRILIPAAYSRSLAPDNEEKLLTSVQQNLTPLQCSLWGMTPANINTGCLLALARAW